MGAEGRGERETFPVPCSGNGNKDSQKEIFKKVKYGQVQ
jgi:hypothetical protein